MEGALARYGAVAPALDARFAALDLEGSAARVAELFGTGLDGRLIAVVGTFAAIAWFDRFEDRPTAFFSLEMIDATPWTRLMAVHELTHMTQAELGGPVMQSVPGLELLREGIAVATTHRLVPGAPPGAHVAIDDHAAWAAACEEQWPRIVRELLAVFDEPDVAQQQRFFWPDWGRAHSDVPMCCGYYVGARLVEDLLAAGHTLGELASWSDERTLSELRGALTAR